MRNSRFDKNTEEILRKAGLLAREMGHSFVGSEHILLSMSSSANSRVGQVLTQNDVTYPKLYALLERIRGQGGRALRLPQGLSPGAQSIIRSAMARSGAKEPLHPEQLLWAIASENSTTAALMLASCGVCAEQLCMLSERQQQGKKGGTMRLLEQFGVNMVQKATTMEPIIGRCDEIDTIIEVLCRKHKNNPALIGDPGVGKTAIVEGLAQRMAARQVPAQLQEKRLYALDTASMVAGTKYRGEFEERMRDILAEIQRAGDIIVFIDEMHMLVGAGAAEGAIDAANILKPSLSRGELQLIGATTVEEYRKFIEKDAALERRFRTIPVKEPSSIQTEGILRGLRPGLERHHGLRIQDEAITAAVRLSQRYLNEHFFPDKALDLLDEGAAHACLCAQRMEGNTETSKRKEMDEALRCAIAQEDFEKALIIQSQLRHYHEQCKNENTRQVTAMDIAYAVSCRTGIPVGEIDTEQREKLQNLEAELSKCVAGQQKAIALVANAVRRGRTGIGGHNRPVAAIMLTGPTGVGKTELCKALAACVYGSRKSMIRLDMTEYMEKHTVSRLIGAPPGYMGYDEGGLLTEKVRRSPYSLVLFDEIDKAHPDVLGILLQIMDDGILTDSMGRTVDFSNTIILMTANIGAQECGKSGLGFVPATEHERTMTQLRQHFSPEFLGRLDAVAVFSPLKKETLIEIAQLQLQALKTRVREQKIDFSYTPEAVEALVAQCGRDSGARSLRHLIQQQVEAPLAQQLLSSEHRRFCLDVAENQLILLE